MDNGLESDFLQWLRRTRRRESVIHLALQGLTSLGLVLAGANVLADHSPVVKFWMGFLFALNAYVFHKNGASHRGLMRTLADVERMEVERLERLERIRR